MIVRFLGVGHGFVRAIELIEYSVKGAMQNLETNSDPEEPPSFGGHHQVEMNLRSFCVRRRIPLQFSRP